MLFRRKKKPKGRPPSPGQDLDRLHRRFQEDPTSRAFFPLAEALRRSGDLNGAAEVLEEGLTHHPEDVGARTSLGRTYMQLGQDNRALKELLQVVQRSSENVKAQELLAEVYERCGYMPEAILLVRSMMIQRRRDPRLTDRERHLITRIRRDPFSRKESPEGWTPEVVEIYLEFSLLEEAERVLEEILTRKGATPEVVRLQQKVREFSDPQEPPVDSPEEPSEPTMVLSVTEEPLERDAPEPTVEEQHEWDESVELLGGQEPKESEPDPDTDGPHPVDPVDEDEATVVLEIPPEVLREVESVWRERSEDEASADSRDGWQQTWEPELETITPPEESAAGSVVPAVEPPPVVVEEPQEMQTGQEAALGTLNRWLTRAEDLRTMAGEGGDRA